MPLEGKTRPRLAINAQINPQTPGGVESNLLSLLQMMPGAASDIDLSILALPEYVQDFHDLVDSQATVIGWIHGQNILGKLLKGPAKRGQRLRSLLGRNAALFDHALRIYRTARYGMRTAVPAASAIDELLTQHGVAAIHFPSPNLFHTALPFIYEPWDLQFLHHPEFFTPEECVRRDRTYREGCRRAALIVTATAWTKNDIVRHYKISPRKIAVIRRASLTASVMLSDDRRKELLTGMGVPEDFIFYPAMTFEHKNHLRLFRALARLRDRDGIRLTLVMTGRRHEPFWPTIEAELGRLGLQDQIINLGAVSDETLTALFSSARFMIFPSLFEGLGIPILEAFRHGLPVLAARESCIPEVAGKAAVLFDGRDEDAIAAGIRRGWQEPEWLQSYAAAAPEQLRKYDWEQAAPTFAACYRQVTRVPLSDDDRARLSAATGD